MLCARPGVQVVHAPGPPHKFPQPSCSRWSTLASTGRRLRRQYSIIAATATDRRRLVTVTTRNVTPEQSADANNFLTGQTTAPKTKIDEKPN